MSDLVGCRARGVLKIFTVSWRFSTATSLDARDVFGNIQIFTEMGRRVEILMRQPKYRSMYKMRNQKLSERFGATISSANTYIDVASR